MLYEIRRRYSLHDGGTKYYQTILIRRKDEDGRFKSGYLIFDWNTATGRPFPRIPKVKSYVGDAVGADALVRTESKKRAEKSKRSYTDWQETFEALESDAELLDWMAKLTDDTVVRKDVIAVFERVDGIKKKAGPITNPCAEIALPGDVPTTEVENEVISSDSINSDNPMWGCW